MQVLLKHFLWLNHFPPISVWVFISYLLLLNYALKFNSSMKEQNNYWMDCMENKDLMSSAHALLIMENIKKHLYQQQLCDVTIIG